MLKLSSQNFNVFNLEIQSLLQCSINTFPAFGGFVMVSTMNGIANAQSSVPRLTQDDSNVPYCSADKLPEYCFDKISCHCSHLVELELCEVYEFQLIDVRGETKNVFIVLLPLLPSSSGKLK